MALHTKLPDLLRAAEHARTDPTLVPNHRGYIDRHLTEILEESEQILELLQDDPCEADFCARLRSECLSIKEALLVYSHAPSAAVR